MEKLGEYVKHTVLNFKLELCCFVASVRVGVLTLACVNIILGFTFLITLAEGGFEPLLLQALNGLSSGDDKPDFKPSCIIAYAVELASSVVLLCAMIRNDLVLLRAYLYYSLGVLTAAVMVYSVVIGAVGILLVFLIVGSVGYQCYLIMLVRSVMVELKQVSTKNGYNVNLRPNIEAPSEPGPREKYGIVIETDGKKPPVAALVKKDIVLHPDVKVIARTVPKEHSTTTAVSVRPEVKVIARAVPAPTPVNETKPELPPKAGAVKVKESTVNAASNQDDKVEKTNETKTDDVKKPTRRFFGKKEKVKVLEKATVETVEETKKI